MKIIVLLSLSALLAACATRHESVVHVVPAAVPGTTLPSEGMESVRYAENIRAYPLNRYIDPNNPGIMHEGHTIYRVETSPKWNLHQASPVSISSPVPSGPIARIRDTAKTTMLLRDDLTVELNKQKEVTKAVVQNSQAVTQKLIEMGTAVQQTKQMAGQATQLQNEINATNQRLNLLEEELRKKQPQSPSQDDQHDW